MVTKKGPLGDGEPRKRTVQRQPRSPEEEAERIVSKEEERFDREQEIELEFLERMERRRARAERIEELKDKRQREMQSRQRNEEYKRWFHEEWMKPHTIEELTSVGLIELFDRHGILRPARRTRLDDMIQALLDEGVPFDLTQEEWESLPHPDWSPMNPNPNPWLREGLLNTAQFYLANPGVLMREHGVTFDQWMKRIEPLLAEDD